MRLAFRKRCPRRDMTTNADIGDTERGQSRRKQVLDAAAECFRRYGFHGSSIARIGQAAGMSPGHIYHYFQNKEAIVAGLVSDKMDELFELTRRTHEASSAGDPVDAFLAQMDESSERRIDPSWAPLELEILAEGARNPEIGALLQDAATAYIAEMRELLLGFPALRALEPAEIDARIHALGAMFDGLVTRSIFHPAMDRAATNRVMKRVVRMLLEDGD